MTIYTAIYGSKRVKLGDTASRPNVITHRQAQRLGIEALSKAGTEGIKAVKWTTDRRRAPMNWKRQAGTLHIVSAQYDQYIFRFDPAEPEQADLSKRYDLKENE